MRITNIVHHMSLCVVTGLKLSRRVSTLSPRAVENHYADLDLTLYYNRQTKLMSTPLGTSLLELAPEDAGSFSMECIVDAGQHLWDTRPDVAVIINAMLDHLPKQAQALVEDKRVPLLPDWAQRALSSNPSMPVSGVLEWPELAKHLLLSPPVTMDLTVISSTPFHVRQTRLAMGRALSGLILIARRPDGTYRAARIVLIACRVHKAELQHNGRTGTRTAYVHSADQALYTAFRPMQLKLAL